MSAALVRTRSFSAWTLVAGLALLAAAPLRAADIYDAAVRHAGRSADDLKRDSLDHPAEVLRLAGIEPGMYVADFLAANRLPNVEHQLVDLNHLSLPAGSLDAVLVIKVYHDLYWVDTDKKNWPDVDPREVLDTLVKALKPGGTLLLVDHSAKPESGSSAASPLHRIDESFARKDFESRALKVVATSNVLRRPDDPRTQISYKGPALGKTDRFVIVFRKGG